MSEPLLVRVTDDSLVVGGHELPRPKGLNARRFAGRMATWLAPHEETQDREERRKRRDRVSAEFLRKFGRELFDTLLGGGNAYAVYRDSADGPIALDLPEDLRKLPWELMHDGELWVAQSRGVVRAMEGGEALGGQRTAGPLRVLALMSAPVLDPMHGAGDRAQPYVGDVEAYAAMFRELDGADFPARFEVVRHATLDDLRIGLEKGADILYFDGHGNADGLLFDDGFGRTRGVDRFTVRQRVQGSGVRVAITNSCLTASQATGECPVAGMLVWAGVPVVVGMQTPILDTAAQCFAREFFGSMGRGRTPVQAVGSARAALQDAHNPKALGDEGWRQVQAWEWAIPVVYVSRDGLGALDATLAAEGAGSAVVRDEVRERLRAEPGAGPNLPQRPAQFVGRRQELVDTADSLAQTKVTVLHGVRGVGKTTLALEAASRAARRFERIVWVRARVESPADALSEATADRLTAGAMLAPGELISRAAAGLGLPEGLPEKEALAAISRELSERRTLLVLDNLDSFAEKGQFARSPVLRDLLAAVPGSSRALLTVAGDLPLGRHIHVAGLPPEMAALLAYVYAREMGVDLSGEEAGLIGVRTGGHPMAIRFAVGLVGRSATREEVLDGLRGMHGRTVDEVLGYVMGRAVEEASGDAKLLFKLASYFPSPILREVLEAGSLWEDRGRFERALAEAVDLRLLEAVAEGEWVLMQELPRAEAGRLRFELPEGPGHGKAMVEWARARKYEGLFCDLVAAWSRYCQQRGHLAEWEPPGREAVRLAEELGDRRRERMARNDLGAWCIRTGNPEEGLKQFGRSADLAREGNDLAAEAAPLGNMGLIYADQGELERALECYRKAYEIAERLNNPQTMASQLGNMGNIHAEQGELERALECYRKAYEIAERLNNPQTMASQLGNMGLIYARQGELERALECHQKASEIAERLNNPQTMASQLGNMGNVYARQGELERALECHQKAYEIDVRLGNPQGQAHDLGNMGLIYMRQGKLAEARGHLERARGLYERTGVKGQGPEMVGTALERLEVLEKLPPEVVRRVLEELAKGQTEGEGRAKGGG